MIQTAEELLLDLMSELHIESSIGELNQMDPQLVPNLIEKINNRTQLYVDAALSAAADNAVAKENPDDYGTGEIWVDRNSILKAYPKYLIK